MTTRQKSTLLWAAHILFVIAILLWLAKVVAYGMTLSPLEVTGSEWTTA